MTLQLVLRRGREERTESGMSIAERHRIGRDEVGHAIPVHVAKIEADPGYICEPDRAYTPEQEGVFAFPRRELLPVEQTGLCARVRRETKNTADENEAPHKWQSISAGEGGSFVCSADCVDCCPL
jgi:hypothetical protein